VAPGSQRSVCEGARFYQACRSAAIGAGDLLPPDAGKYLQASVAAAWAAV